MKVALAQLNYVIGDFEHNVFKIKEHIAKVKKERADLVIFSELSVCGYPPRDFLEFSDFIAQCRKAAEDIAQSCIGITAIIGCPTVNPKTEGKNLFNSAFVCADGKIQDEVHKSLLPNYDIFDEYRYFEPNREHHCITVAGIKIALTICEDLWNIEDDPMYVTCPMDDLINENPQLMINIAASPFDYTHAEQRKRILKRNALKYKLPIVYLNHVGAQTELIFDGGSLIMNDRGEVMHEMKLFEEDYYSLEFGGKGLELPAITPNTEHQTPNKISLVYSALVLGIHDYFSKLGYTKAILGLSGGVDSAVVLCLAVEALGKDNVLPVLMPSPFSSFESVTDSLALCKNLSVHHELIPIDHVYEEYLHALHKQFKDMPFNVAEENLQARTRGTLLMAMANKFGYILLNTSNKSELAVGYGTLYGDMAGGLSVIGDVYKTELYELAEYINKDQEIIPLNILKKAPSAELRPDQKDTDTLPDYGILDKILFQYIEKRKGPDELLKMGFNKDIVAKTLSLVNANEYKRWQFAPILRISPKSFGMGRRMPIVGKYLS